MDKELGKKAQQRAKKVAKQQRELEKQYDENLKQISRLLLEEEKQIEELEAQQRDREAAEQQRARKAEQHELEEERLAEESQRSELRESTDLDNTDCFKVHYAENLSNSRSRNEDIFHFKIQFITENIKKVELEYAELSNSSTTKERKAELLAEEEKRNKEEQRQLQNKRDDYNKLDPTNGNDVLNYIKNQIGTVNIKPILAADMKVNIEPILAADMKVTAKHITQNEIQIQNIHDNPDDFKTRLADERKRLIEQLKQPFAFRTIKTIIAFNKRMMSLNMNNEEDDFPVHSNSEYNEEEWSEYVSATPKAVKYTISKLVPLLEDDIKITKRHIEEVKTQENNMYDRSHDFQVRLINEQSRLFEQSRQLSLFNHDRKTHSKCTSSTNLDIIDKQMISAASQLVKLMNPSTSTEQKEQLLVDEAERIKAEFANLNKKKDEYNKLGVGKDLNFDVQQYMCNCFISPPNIQKV